MNEAVLLVGVGCVIAAVVGGGLSLANLKVPVVTSLPRQVLLGVIGLIVVVGSFLLPDNGKDHTTGGTEVTTIPDNRPTAPRPPSCAFDTSTPEITLSADHAPRGAALTVFGSGFCAGELVEIRVHVTSVGTATADGTGRFTQRVTVPESAPPPGFPTDVAATGHTSSKTATAPFSTS